MDKIRIAGGRPLSGEVSISGAKNSALPCIAAALLTSDTVHLDNVPRLVKDVATMRLLLEHLGCDTMWEGNRLSIQARNVDLFEAPYDMVKTMRASVLVLGPLVARFGKAVVSMPGGCAIGARPIDLHLAGLEALGARIRIEHGYVLASAPKLIGARYRFANVTVTGTENLLLAASLAEGETILENCAMEPEVEDVIRLARSMGAQIEGDNTDTLRIRGVPALHGTTHSVIPDRIETGTFLMAGAMTGGQITVKRCMPQHLAAAIEKLRQNGCSIDTGEDWITIEAPSQLQPSDVETHPYPYFPTDLQAQYMALMTQAEGTTNIYENIFENRFMHVAELRRMGAHIIVQGHVAHVHGKTPLSGASVMATDLRASACLLIAGLVAEGVTMLQRVYHIDRGYERIEEKLRGLGADVERIS
ncbi:UDP-N-acetylglucosamine 1-carboxyvinyltransferase [bacterium]|nr:UDP-N-acetylglucosamine 1-carboxyvinyltransferase [bacterium]MCI0605061.1 UDP-N-acetylglucosamine 1-carboxyvinyltransferase [bacterium]